MYACSLAGAGAGAAATSPPFAACTSTYCSARYMYAAVKPANVYAWLRGISPIHETMETMAACVPEGPYPACIAAKRGRRWLGSSLAVQGDSMRGERPTSPRRRSIINKVYKQITSSSCIHKRVRLAAGHPPYPRDDGDQGSARPRGPPTRPALPPSAAAGGLAAVWQPKVTPSAVRGRPLLAVDLLLIILVGLL